MLHTSDGLSDFRPPTEFGDSKKFCEPASGLSRWSVAARTMKMLWVSVAVP
jgi:hypothetical protein